MEQKNYIPNIPETDKKRIVIVGSGFAGLKLLRSLLGKIFQIVLLDKNNFHQFQTLLYQVATAGLEPSAISFPLRKILQKEKHIHFRIADVKEVRPDLKEIKTDVGHLKYDYLVLAMGANTNFFGQENIERYALSMKLKDFEYRDKGALATIGRNLAVADLPFVKMSGFIAWILWSFVHLFMIVGVKNRILIFLNWSWNYFTYDQSLRLLIRRKPSIINRSKEDAFCETIPVELKSEASIL